MFDDPAQEKITSEKFLINWPKFADKLIDFMISSKPVKVKNKTGVKGVENNSTQKTTVRYFSTEQFKVKKENIINDGKL